MLLKSKSTEYVFFRLFSLHSRKNLILFDSRFPIYLLRIYMYTYIFNFSNGKSVYSNSKYKNFHDTVLGKLSRSNCLECNNFGIMHNLSNLIINKSKIYALWITFHIFLFWIFKCIFSKQNYLVFNFLVMCWRISMDDNFHS